MTTFTTEDRINASPPHIVDSGASVMGMSANELADILKSSQFQIDEDGVNIGVSRQALDEAAAMLRQQQAELTEAGHMIGVLREYISDLEKGLDSSIYLNKAQAERNGEPVVWTSCLDCGKRVTGDSIHTCSPQLKELTDEEILQFQDKVPYTLGSDLIEFAKAILRKAQEK